MSSNRKRINVSITPSKKKIISIRIGVIEVPDDFAEEIRERPGRICEDCGGEKDTKKIDDKFRCRDCAEIYLDIRDDSEES